jgi:preprotein translocase subunit YajC
VAFEIVLAQAAPGGGMGPIFLMLGMLAIFYFLLFRPQQKQLKEHRALLGSLKKGDDVVTQGGVLGKVYAITDKIVTLDVASGVKMRVLKTSIQARYTSADETAVGAAKVEQKEEK